MRKFLFLILICIGWLYPQAQQQRYQFSHLDISKGLSNNQVSSFLKDQKGFMWIGTMSGLNRYDGYQFKVFRHDIKDSTSLSDDFITGISEGPDGKLWITTKTGINIFDPATEKFERNISKELNRLGLLPIPITGIAKDKNGDFLFLQNGTTLSRYDHLLKKSILLYRVSIIGKSIANLKVDKKGQCWLIYQDGLLEGREIKSGKLTYSTGIVTRIFGESPGLYSLFADNENELWIYPAENASKLGLIRFNPETNKSLYFEKNKGEVKLNTNLVVGIVQDSKGDIWICTDHGGVNLYNKKSNSIQYLLNNVDDDKSLSQNSIMASYQDNNGTIWLGTYKRGVNYYRANSIKFPVYRHVSSNPGSLIFEDVNRFVEDSTGNIWIGTNGGGLLYFDRAKNKFTQFLNQPGNPNSISNNVIVSLWIDHQQNLWIGSFFGGLDCYKNGHFTHYRHDEKNDGSIADDGIWEIFKDSKQNLWVGTLDGGLDLYDKEKNIFYHHSLNIPNSIHSNYVSAIIEDSENKLWIGTDKGIDVMDQNKDQIIHYTSSSGLSNNMTLSILEDSRGLIWVGTSNGLNVFNKKQQTFKSFRTEEGLPGNTILNILEDNSKTLWVSTNNGVSKLNVITSDTTINIACLNFDVLDGLQGTEFNENAALKTSAGEIIFGGANGFNIFHPEQITTDRSPQHLVLTDLQIVNKSINKDEEINGRVLLSKPIYNMESIELKYNENIVGIEFAALNFSTPQKIKYAYMLEGFDKEWIYTDWKMRKAVYTNLDPGDYTFHLKATTEEGMWSDKELLFKIKILPPFWMTSFAFFVYLLLSATALWFARKIILERAGMRFEAIQQRKEAERIKAIDVMKTKFFTNVSHEFRTPLSLILSPLDKIVKESTDPNQKKQLHLIQRNAKRLLNLVNQLLDFRKMEVNEFSVLFSRADFIKFAKDITNSFSDIAEKKDIDLTFQTNIESFQMLFDKDKMEKIFFNLLSNAFKYTPSMGKINVAVLVDGEMNNAVSESPNVIIKIEDSGIGIPAESQRKIFEPYFQHVLPGNMHNYGTGIGLAITTEFLKLHNGTIKVESEPGKGSCFIISLPIRKEDGFSSAVEIAQTALAQVETTSLSMDIENEENLAIPHDIQKHTILLVEDNEDFRFYLKDNLKHSYNVIVAVDGKEGWEKVRNLHPDMVVSDLMMPEMNGIELSKKIKTDPATSHIPILLLTAMTMIEKELEGFQAGANDYVTKPFTFEILESRIRNLLNLRLQMQEKFQKQLEVDPAEITISSVDEEFMKRTLVAVEKNYDNPEFSVEDLSRELFMSRVSLYKKILSITGKTPIEFIRVMRLKRAAKLLKGGKMNVSEVAYEVGYNNPKIFTKYFKEEFNMTPSQYQAQNGG